MVSPTVTTEALSGIDDFFFRVCSTTRLFATRNAEYQLKQNRMHRVAAAYGVNHDRLLKLKNRYDPGNLFRMNQNIPPAD